MKDDLPETCDDPECFNCAAKRVASAYLRSIAAQAFWEMRKIDPARARAIWKQMHEHKEAFKHHLRQIEYGPGYGGLQ